MGTRNFVFAFALIAVGCHAPEQPAGGSVQAVMDSVITRLYAEVPPEKYDSIDDAFMLSFINDAEKKVLATRYQYFDVNVPVIVSLMRHKDQATIPFWLAETGFVKTDRLIKNEEYDYEVWEKKYGPGHVALGINGFDKHRPVYFISVAPQNSGDVLKITNVFPAGFALDTLRTGAFTYHDWSGLVLTEVPHAMEGQVLFTTVRGRAREAHVRGAFRKTIFPAQAKPDQVMLTWSGDTKTTVDIQWRSHTSVSDGTVVYWPEGSGDSLSVAASRAILQDRMLYNDRYTHRFTAQLTSLKPGTVYHYRVGSHSGWSDVFSFRTAPAQHAKFAFVWFGDTHCFPDSGKLVNLAAAANRDAAFYSIAGDLVSTGLYRDEWDRLFGYAGTAFAHKPLMPVLGNHDRQDGLGAQLYYDLFSLPENAPKGVTPEGTYAFEYGDALFLMIDATSDVAGQTPWIEEQLANAKATWKFAMFHFPPYNFEEPYLDIQQAWVPLFDRYHVDVVMGGHIHYYMRSLPMAGGQVVRDPSKGTVYTISISIPSKHEVMPQEPYAAKQLKEGYFYQRMEIDGKTLTYKAVDSNGVVQDAFTIHK